MGADARAHLPEVEGDLGGTDRDLDGIDRDLDGTDRDLDGRDGDLDGADGSDEPGAHLAGVRFRYTKLGRIRFTSHRDVARMWERGLRRSGLPVAWSEGFSPRPLLSFGLALPTSCESLAEYVDVRLAPGVAVAAAPSLARLLGPLLPDGIEVPASGAILRGADSLQQEVTSCSWELEVLGVTVGELAERIERLLAAPSVPVRRERKGRLVEDDLRPSVLVLTSEQPERTPQPGLRDGPTDAPSAPLRVHAELATRPRGVRPPELLQELGADIGLARACRTNQWIERDGARLEPLAVDGDAPGPVAPHADGRAS
jgi:radical SAM-linked protein